VLKGKCGLQEQKGLQAGIFEGQLSLKAKGPQRENIK
jgi:hypothetical protein